MNDDFPPPLPKKRLSGPAKVGIGCGCFLGLIALVMGAVFAGVFWKYDVRVDEASGDVTITERKTSKRVMSMKGDDMRQGKMVWTDEKGNTMTFDPHNKDEPFKSEPGKTDPKAGKPIEVNSPNGKIIVNGDAESTRPPAWIPAYPGETPLAGGMKTPKASRLSGMSKAETTDDVAKVHDFYVKQFTEAGFKVTTANVNEVKASHETEKRTASITITASDKKTVFLITYDGPK